MWQPSLGETAHVQNAARTRVAWGSTLARNNLTQPHTVLRLKPRFDGRRGLGWKGCGDEVGWRTIRLPPSPANKAAHLKLALSCCGTRRWFREGGRKMGIDRRRPHRGRVGEACQHRRPGARALGTPGGRRTGRAWKLQNQRTKATMERKRRGGGEMGGKKIETRNERGPPGCTKPLLDSFFHSPNAHGKVCMRVMARGGGGAQNPAAIQARQQRQRVVPLCTIFA